MTFEKRVNGQPVKQRGNANILRGNAREEKLVDEIVLVFRGLNTNYSSNFEFRFEHEITGL